MNQYQHWESHGSISLKLFMTKSSLVYNSTANSTLSDSNRWFHTARLNWNTINLSFTKTCIFYQRSIVMHVVEQLSHMNTRCPRLTSRIFLHVGLLVNEFDISAFEFFFHQLVHRLWLCIGKSFFPRSYLSCYDAEKFTIHWQSGFDIILHKFVWCTNLFSLGSLIS